MDGPMVPIRGGQTGNLLELIPGRDKTVGLDDHPLAGILGGLFFALPGSLVLWVLVPECPKSLLNRDFAGAGLAAFGALFGALFVFPLCLYVYVLIDSSRCKSIDELTVRLGVPEDAVRQVAREKGVVARYNVKGRSVYRTRDFDSLRLLRASEADESRELLRAPAQRTATDDILLRTSSPPRTAVENGEGKGDA